MPDYLNTTHRTIAWLKKAHDQGALEMKPPFQRNPVWSDVQKSYLMDSILRGFPVPELYMQEEVDENGDEKQIVVDGQQRTRACLEFLEGKFTIDAEQSPGWADMSFEDLSAAQKKKFYAYQFVVRKLPSVPDSQLREIFQRLNKNVVALNEQELRHATYGGVFIRLVEKLADLEYWEGTGLFSPNAVRRMMDVEFISELAVAVLHGPQNKKLTLDKWYATYEKDFEEEASLESLFMTVIGELQQVLPDIRKTRWRKRSDFYTLFCVLAAHEDLLPLNKTDRKKASTSLQYFGSLVDEYVTAEKAQAKARLSALPKAIRRYAVAVQRAASDLGSRKDRFDVLNAYVKRILQ